MDFLEEVAMASGLLWVGWLRQARPLDGGAAVACSWFLSPPTSAWAWVGSGPGFFSILSSGGWAEGQDSGSSSTGCLHVMVWVGQEIGERVRTQLCDLLAV